MMMKKKKLIVYVHIVFFFNMKNSWFGKKRGYTNVIEAFPFTQLNIGTAFPSNIC